MCKPIVTVPDLMFILIQLEDCYKTNFLRAKSPTYLITCFRIKNHFRSFFVGPFTKEEEIRILNTAIRINKRNLAERNLGDMWNETRKLLTEYYSSYNERLAKLLQDNRFLWSD